MKFLEAIIDIFMQKKLVRVLIFLIFLKKFLSNCLAFISKKNSLNVQDLFLEEKNSTI